MKNIEETTAPSTLAIATKGRAKAIRKTKPPTHLRKITLTCILEEENARQLGLLSARFGFTPEEILQRFLSEHTFAAGGCMDDHWAEMGNDMRNEREEAAWEADQKAHGFDGVAAP